MKHVIVSSLAVDPCPFHSPRSTHFLFSLSNELDQEFNYVLRTPGFWDLNRRGADDHRNDAVVFAEPFVLDNHPSLYHHPITAVDNNRAKLVLEEEIGSSFSNEHTRRR